MVIYLGFMRDFRKEMHFFLYIYLLQNYNNYKLWRVLSVLNGDWKVIGWPLSNQSFSGISDFSDTCALLHYHAEAMFLLDSCKAEVIWKTFYFFGLLNQAARLTYSQLDISLTIITSSQYQRTVILTSPTDTEFLNSFFMQYWGWNHFSD